MKRISQMVCTMFCVAFFLIGIETYATELAPSSGFQDNQVLTEETVVEETIASETATTAVTEDYVRITQPNIKDEIQTFDSQMHIMGEASVGTEIQIIVYYGDTVEVLDATIEQATYKLKVVGATQTFSELIDLKEGQNNILIRYQYSGQSERGTLAVKVLRRSQAEKELIQSVLNPQVLAEKIVSPVK